jgi:hypothetical protein
MSDAVDWGLEMHPDNRPDSVEVFRSAFDGQVKRNDASLRLEAQPTVADALGQNSAIAALVLALFALAVALTLF